MGGNNSFELFSCGYYLTFDVTGYVKVWVYLVIKMGTWYEVLNFVDKFLYNILFVGIIQDVRSNGYGVGVGAGRIFKCYSS